MRTDRRRQLRVFRLQVGDHRLQQSRLFGKILRCIQHDPAYQRAAGKSTETGGFRKKISPRGPEAHPSPGASSRCPPRPSQVPPTSFAPPRLHQRARKNGPAENPCIISKIPGNPSKQTPPCPRAFPERQTRHRGLDRKSTRL